ncbi:MAG: hypothetical protein V7L21_05745 [Nostoc sp.]|uniref:hypothetical protein n=1 Tax=unclassified Nostoc TaxID=2593658 RepID=UPI0025EC810D|nr:hypothetical protein [Nostoc sp. NMS9]MBN3944130.1 hypothetical protein [Nostoc sp. NMS9]
MQIKQHKSDVLLDNDFLSYLVVAYALVTEDLAKHTGQPAIVHRVNYLDIGQQKFHQFSDEELHTFLKENYPT